MRSAWRAVRKLTLCPSSTSPSAFERQLTNPSTLERTDNLRRCRWPSELFLIMVPGLALNASREESVGRGWWNAGWRRKKEREFFNDNLLARIYFIILMIRWTGLAPWEFGFHFPSSLTSTFLGGAGLLALSQHIWSHLVSPGSVLRLS